MEKKNAYPSGQKGSINDTPEEQLPFKKHHRLLVIFLAKQPLLLLQIVGYLFGTLAFLLRSNSRRQALLFAKQAQIPNAWWTVLQSYGDFGRTVLEAPWVWLNPPSLLLSKCKIDIDWRLLPKLSQNIPKEQLTIYKNADSQPIINIEKKPMMVFGLHLGCFDAGAAFIQKYFDCSVIYQKQKDPFIHAIRYLQHEGHQKTHIMNTGGLRTLLRQLQQGGNICLLTDQTPLEGSGEWIDFFNKPAYTMMLAPQLSLVKNVFCVHGVTYHRWGGFNIRLRIIDGLPESKKERAKVFNTLTENAVQEFPTQYRWAYDRYRFRKR